MRFRAQGGFKAWQVQIIRRTLGTAVHEARSLRKDTHERPPTSPVSGRSTRRGAPGRQGRLRGATRPQCRDYLKLCTRLEMVRLHPSTNTNNKSLNGKEIIAGGSMNMPILISTDATTVSMMMNGR